MTAQELRTEQAETRARSRWSWMVDPETHATLGNGQVVRRHPKLNRAEKKAASRAKVRPPKDMSFARCLAIAGPLIDELAAL